MDKAVPPVTTWLIRHGQSAANAGLPSVGQDDTPLTELGLEQAHAAARRVDRQPDLLVVSPFTRARATGEVIQARWPVTECETWRCDPYYVDGPDAESFSAFVGRLRDFHARLLWLDRRYVVAVGHGQFFEPIRWV